MKRIAFLTLCILVMLTVSGCSAENETQKMTMGAEKSSDPLFSNKSQEVSLEEIKEIAQDLLEKGETAVLLIGGTDLKEGLLKTTSVSTDEDFLPVTGGKYHSIREIKEEVESVFTTEVAQEYYNQFLCQDDPVYKEVDGTLYYNRNHRKFAGLSTWQVDTAIIMRQTADEITVEMNVVTPGSQSMKKNLRLKKIAGEWLLDSVILLS